jgi:hypothetical protein
MDNGLYFLRVEPAGGGKAANGGVFVLRNGKILGGDAFFYYVGSYRASAGNWTGEFSTHQHTRSDLAKPVFGAREATVFFSGSFADTTAEIEATSKAEGAERGFRVALCRIADA